MKRTTFAVLLSLLLIASCVFAACNTDSSIFNDNPDTTATDTSNETETYTAMIRELETQIIQLQQNQSITDAEREQKLLQLETLLAQLQESVQESADSSTTQTPDPLPAEATFRYTVHEGQATLTEYMGTDKHLTLPSYIDGYQIVAIADNAFSSDTLESVTVPEGVTKIGWFAFADCTQLNAVTLPPSVTSIGYSAFPKSNKSFTIYCQADSFAQQYAKSYGMAYAVI